MGKDVDIVVRMQEADPDTLALVLLSECHPAFNLNGQIIMRRIGHVPRDHVTAVPVVSDGVSGEAVLRQPRSYLMKVVNFLLPGVELGIKDLAEKWIRFRHEVPIKDKRLRATPLKARTTCPFYYSSKSTTYYS